MNINNYNDLLEYLDKYKDNQYKEFTARILKNDKIELLGVRTPKLKEIAKYLSKKNYTEFILTQHKTYEEKLIHGLILGYIKIEFNELLQYIKDFIPYIDNWSTCDLTIANLKAFKKKQDQGYEFIKKCIKSKNIWEQRFGIVLINAYYINDEYINKNITLLKNISTNEYYVQMALAWCLSTCYIKYPDITINLLKENKLEKTIHNKTIQKIIESKKISIEEKQELKKLKKQ